MESQCAIRGCVQHRLKDHQHAEGKWNSISQCGSHREPDCWYDVSYAIRCLELGRCALQTEHWPGILHAEPHQSPESIWWRFLWSATAADGPGKGRTG